ncbi:CBS domain-containing protein [Limimaricola variabilis]|uniref:CBS domain-containing protein n=1 Tax=Limimaricola variabilis TaxID=1492771 RepID=A0ABR6HML3_9RHOB|nr:CBS domain-containing protein [Limimaricola variabilis]MBB3711802.1 CBS domain-containing protein [Limimaricola variabilis]
MKPLPRISEIMTREVITVTPGMNLQRAMHLMAFHGVSGLPVVDDEGRPFGMLSQRDCLKGALESAYHGGSTGRVEEVMHAPVEGLPADMDLLTAIERFLASRYRRFPVFEAGAMVGILARGDLVRALANWDG